MRRAALVVVLSMGLGLVVAAPSTADESLASGFQSFSLVAVSGGQRIVANDIAGQSPGTVESGVPEAEAAMTDSSAHALSSVAWPSALAGNAGTLLLLLGPYPCTPSALFDAFGIPFPPMCSPVGTPEEVMNQYHYLNTPIRAEAFSPGKPTDDNSVPGAIMTARAGTNEAAADAVIGTVLVSDLERFNSARATSIVRPTGATSAVADARSTVTDIVLAGGEVTIGSVTSSAHGETDGTTAKSSGATTIHDMKVHGVPVTVNDKGVHASGQTADAVGPATAAVNEVLAGFGMKMFVTRPTQVTKGAVTTFDSGSLIIEWLPPGAPGGVVFEFGGAHILAAATLPFDDSSLVSGLDDLLAAPEGFLDTPSLGFDEGGNGVVSGLGTSQSGSPSLAAQPISALPSLPGGTSVWWVVLALLAALAAAFGLGRLPARVLDTAGTDCEEER